MRHAIQFYYVLVIASFLHVNHSSIPVEASIADAHAHVHTNRHTSFKTSSTKMTAFIQQQTHNYNNAKNNNNYNYHHHHYHYYYYNHLHPKTRTKLHLNFNNYESTNNENKQTITRAVTLQTLKRTISNDLIQQLETRRDASSIILPFTHTFQVKRLHSTTTTTTKQSSKGEYLCIRPLMKKDLPDAVRMCVREFGSYANKSNTQIRSDTSSSSSSSSSSKSNLDTFDLNTSIMNKSKQIKLPSKIQTIMDDFFTMYENFVFAFVVQLGLDQRIERQQLGDDPTKSNIVPDHNVLCLISLNDQQQEQELIGITEISIQPLNPTRTAPPFVLPLFIKQIISQLDSDASLPIAYVSNVLIKESYRGMGYAKLLMAAVEGRAKEMGYDELFLHVDANTAGTNAQNLYWGLGYQSYDKYKDNPSQSPFAWMGDEFVNKNKGLYLVDGAPLLYLTKKINND